MKQLSARGLIFGVALSAVCGTTGYAQSQSLASTMEVYVFPSEGQDSSQQSKDESECYNYANTSTGNDPFALAKQEDANQSQSEAEMDAAEKTGKGAGVRGAIGGAAIGAVVGEVTGGDAGESAAIGAAVIGVRGRRQGRRAEAQATAQAEAQAEQRQTATAHDLENFKKAFSVCLEAKKYMVKY